MPGLLNSAPIDDELRRSNDRHRPLIALAVLGVLAIYVYLFTQAAGTIGLRLPAQLAWDLGVEAPDIFDDDGNVSSNLSISMTDRFARSDDERLVFFGIVAAAFLSAYFLPLRFKQASLVAWAGLGRGVLFGVETTCARLFAHRVVYAVLHPPPPRGWLPSGAAGGAA
ncbi:MAG: hypothetical protein VX246_15910, partial [Myxococcota bacterium]|nr:hypothetical protein [Myxococcota bacterium]